MTGDKNKNRSRWFHKQKPSSAAAVNKSGLSTPSTLTPAHNSVTSLHQPAKTYSAASTGSVTPSEDGLKDVSVTNSNKMGTTAPSERKGMILAVSKQVFQAFEIGLKAAPIPNLDLIATGLLKFVEVYEVSLSNWAHLKLRDNRKIGG